MDSVDDLNELIDKNDAIGSSNELNELITGIIEKLPPRYAAVINLFYLEQLSIKEISDVMETTDSNVKILLHRSRNALKDIIVKNNLQEEFL